jgi:hypothetical protein
MTQFLPPSAADNDPADATAKLLTALTGRSGTYAWPVFLANRTPMIITATLEADGNPEIVERTRLDGRIRRLGRPLKTVLGELVEALLTATEAKRERILRTIDLLTVVLVTWQDLLAKCKAPDDELEALFEYVADAVFVSQLRNLLDDRVFVRRLAQIQVRIDAFVMRCRGASNDDSAAAA